MRVTIQAHDGGEVFATDLPPQVMLGRQDTGQGDPLPFAIAPAATAGQFPKLIITPHTDFGISRLQLLLEQRGNQVRLKNVSSAIEVVIEGAPRLSPGEECLQPLPAAFFLAGYRIALAHPSDRKSGSSEKSSSFEMLDEAVEVPGRPLATRRAERNASLNLASLRSSFKGEAHEELLLQLENVIQALQQTAASDQFFRDLVETAAAEIELDEAVVVMRRGQRWECVAQAGQNAMQIETWPPALALLAEVVQERKAGRKSHAAEATSAGGRIVSSLVAAPILDIQGTVIGALYGQRYAPSSHITRMDIRLVKILATGAAAALVRAEQDKTILKTNVLFEQFVTPRIARHVHDNPHVLTGYEAETSLLFCDIAGFSRVTERLTPAQTINWINDVLEELSQCVLQEEGTLVDYVGDELFALFGAPVSQADHAARACRAGLRMLAAVKTLNDRWRERLQEEISVGLGVNTGSVLVGNVGSATKLKFGAHGTPVNIASRVQSATRYFGTRFLTTAATVEQLGPGFHTRRVCQVRVKNIKQPISLFELSDGQGPNWQTVKQEYENALKQWEAGHAEQALTLLSTLTHKHPDDGPTKTLLQRAQEAVQRQQPTQAVWELPGK